MVGILLVTHGEIGLALYNSAIHILGKEPSNIDYISIKVLQTLDSVFYCLIKNSDEGTEGPGCKYGATKSGGQEKENWVER